jgi:copper chaperone CopZ
MVRFVVLFAVALTTLRAEFLHVEVFMRDMNCEPCSQSLDSAFKRLRGVENVKVDFKAGTVALDLTARNQIGLEQVWDAIKRVGFTPGETKVSVRGTVNGSKLEVPEINKTFEIEGRAPQGEGSEFKGVTAPPPDPRTPVRIRVAN